MVRCLTEGLNTPTPAPLYAATCISYRSHVESSVSVNEVCRTLVMFLTMKGIVS